MAQSTANNSTFSLKQLEASTGLPLNGEVLKIIKASSYPNNSEYAADLAILVYGYNAINQSYSVQGSPQCTVTPQFYKDFMRFLKENGLGAAAATTPGGQKDHFKSIGSLGSFLPFTAHNPRNPMTGPAVNHPSLVGNLLEDIHPGMINDLENFCNVIRTHAYLSMPSDVFGGINSIMWYITGAVTAFYQAIVEIYQGLEQVIRDFYVWMNGIMRMINNYIISLIEQIVPLSLVCLILDAVQTILDDIGFFASLFNGSDNLFKTLNSIQTVVNYASYGVNFAYDPLGGLASLFPQQVGQVFNFIDSIGQIPNSFLSKLVSNFGFAGKANNQGLAIANAIIQHYGLGAQLGPLGPILASAGVAGNNSKWYRTGNTGVTVNGNKVYLYGLTNPIGGVPMNIALNPPLPILSMPSNFN